MTTSQADGAVDLAKRIHDVLQRYAYERTKARTGKSPEDFPLIVDPTSGNRRRAVDDDYGEKFRKVCEDAFLTMRSCRTREDFVGFFTGTICSVPQRIPMEDFQRLAVALLGSDDEWEQIKALGMLALSALSSRFLRAAAQTQ